MFEHESSYAVPNRFPLRFRDGKFRILSISDLHGVVNYDRRLTRDLGALLDGVKPDLLLILGDVADHDALESAENLRGYLTDLNAVMAARHIPWAHTFGNHDCEAHRSFSQMAVYEEMSHCVSKRGPEEIHGVTNYVLPISSEDGGEILFNVWLLDSHDSLGDLMREFDLGDPASKWDYQCAYPSCLHGWSCGYNTLNVDQVLWYYNGSRYFEKQAGRKVPGLLGLHIPLPEYRVIYQNPAESYYEGIMRETVGNSPVNSGLLNAMMDRGDVKTVVAGHDHINDCTGTYMGIKLTYDAGLSYDCYCHDDLRGGRVFDLTADDPADVKTYMVRARDYVKEN
ncbi:MAG: metallophosphoesterase [Clostridia bacterium]|nr:metallophosphoesterase [Clostridia bacterium]